MARFELTNSESRATSRNHYTKAYPYITFHKNVIYDADKATKHTEFSSLLWLWYWWFKNLILISLYISSFPGPFSHLFRSVHEQNYIAYVMAYSACIGPYRDNCHKSDSSSATSLTITTAAPAFIISLLLSMHFTSLCSDNFFSCYSHLSHLVKP